MRIVIIGAGPSGLVTLKYAITAHAALQTDPIDVMLFESEAGVGGTFYARTYEDAELVSSKQLTTFSDFRPLRNDSDFLSAKRYIEYLNDYCTHFKLWPHIHLSTTVQAIARKESGRHVVTYLDKTTGKTDVWECDAIAVCSGLHVVPNMPNIPGIERVPSVFHSSQFKKREQFGVDKTVVVLGSGETGADISYLAVTSPTRQVVMCHRNGFHFAPKRNLNPVFLPCLARKPNGKLTVPLDNSRASLFDTAYVHPKLRNSMALWIFYDIYVRRILWLTTGTTHGLDQWVGGPSPHRNHVSRLFFNKSNNASAYISAPYRDLSTPIQRLRSAIIQAPLKDTAGRSIDLAPWPERIDESTGAVIFRTNDRLESARMRAGPPVIPDVLVFCTGYRQEFSFFDGRATPAYPVAGDADVRDVWLRNDPSIGFIGFVRPGLGAIPPLSEMQAQLWLLRVLAPERLGELRAEDEDHYRLHMPRDGRIRYGVDHDSYVYQLALDMDSAPGFIEMLRMAWRRRDEVGCWRLPLAWALSANTNVKFRLRGPWKWEGAEEVMVTEIWETILRRRWFYDHFLLSILPMMIFGPLSLLVYVYVSICDLAKGAMSGVHGVTRRA